LVATVFYLSWLPNGHLGKETYLPLWLINWSNTYFNLRTAIPFTALVFLLEARHSITDKSFRGKRTLPFWVINTIIATVIVCLAEGGQFFISNRHPDIKDIAFGILGSLLGCVLYYLFNIFIRLLFIKK
jgi:glycopeptide antibiotics resistance protein